MLTAIINFLIFIVLVIFGIIVVSLIFIVILTILIVKDKSSIDDDKIEKGKDEINNRV